MKKTRNNKNKKNQPEDARKGVEVQFTLAAAGGEERADEEQLEHVGPEPGLVTAVS